MQIFTIYLLFAMLLVLWYDGTRYLIPNWLTGSLVALYPLAVWLSPHPIDWQMALAGFGLVFAVGYLVFAKGWMGGGDIKLIIVLSLWAGWEHLLDFIFLFGVLGGLFALIIWMARKFLPMLPKAPAKIPRILRDGEPMPYGVAIALAFLWLLSQGMVAAA